MIEELKLFHKCVSLKGTTFKNSKYHIIYRISSENVIGVSVGGKILMKLFLLDETVGAGAGAGVGPGPGGI